MVERTNGQLAGGGAAAAVLKVGRRPNLLPRGLMLVQRDAGPLMQGAIMQKPRKTQLTAGKNVQQQAAA